MRRAALVGLMLVTMVMATGCGKEQPPEGKYEQRVFSAWADDLKDASTETRMKAVQALSHAGGKYDALLIERVKDASENPYVRVAAMKATSLSPQAVSDDGKAAVLADFFKAVPSTPSADLLDAVQTAGRLGEKASACRPELEKLAKRYANAPMGGSIEYQIKTAISVALENISVKDGGR